MNLLDYEIESLRAENERLKAKIEALSSKSKRFTEIWDESLGWVVRHFSKDYKGAEYNEQKHYVDLNDVTFLWDIIRNLKVENTNKAQVVEALIDELDLNFKDHKEFSGNRKQYFQLYYYPLVILDDLGYVEYKRNIKIKTDKEFGDFNK